MRSAAVAALSALALVTAPVAAATPADGASNAGDKVRVLVAFERPPSDAAVGRLRAAGARVRFRFDLVPAVAIEVPERALDGIRRHPGVVRVEADAPIRAFDHAGSTADFEYRNAWGVTHIGAPAAQAAGVTGVGVKVAVIDTGIDYIHDDPDDDPYVVDPEFLGNYAGGIDIYNGDNDPMDDNGHGTHVSGILAAERNQYLVVGVAPDVELYGVKILNANGEGEYSHLIAGLEWAVANGMDVVNMSLGGQEVSETLAQAVREAHAAGLLMVAASGNVNPLDWYELFYGCPVAYPAAYPEVLATTFTDGNDALTGYSCTGPEVDVAAPGDQIFSPVPIGPCMFCTEWGYDSLSGTSMASPHLAGLVALLLDAGVTDPEGDGYLDDVRDVICATADDGYGVLSTPISTDDPRYPEYFGCGVIDAEEAVLSVLGSSPPPNQPPVANADTSSTAEDTPATIAVLANDSDPDADALAVTAAGPAANGSVVRNADGTVTYTPSGNWSGTDAFDYTVSDGELTATATVSVTVSPVDDTPTAAGVSATTAAGSPVQVTLSGTDVDTCELTFEIVDLPANGGVGGTTSSPCASSGAGGTDTATVTYTPDAGFTGTDTFSYRVRDATTPSAAATVTITVNPGTHHVGDLDGSRSLGSRNWSATVTIAVHYGNETAAAGAIVSGTWSGAASGPASCTTNASGVCTVTKGNLNNKKSSITFTVTGVSLTGSTYQSSANHDAAETDSNGTQITIFR